MDKITTPKRAAIPPAHEVFLIIGVVFVALGMIGFSLILPPEVRLPVGGCLIAIGAYNFLAASYLARRTIVKSSGTALWNPWQRAGAARVREMFRHIGIVLAIAGAVFVIRALLG